MKPVFGWLLGYGAVWLAGFAGHVPALADEVWRLPGLAGFFGAFFALPLLAAKPTAQSLLFGVQTALAAVTLYPSGGDAFNPFLLLVFALQAGDAARQIPSLKQAAPLAAAQALGLAVQAAGARPAPETWLFAGLFMALLWIGAGMALIARVRGQSAAARYDALLAEYRGLKRRSVSEEEWARQEERMLIGREIHDSVGHKLTALLLQLEAMRLKADGRIRVQAEQLKKLAQESLEETRRAVRSFRQAEPGGLQGIMRLIRNLESNHFLRVHFSVSHGAFSFPLTGEQSFAVYRAVQEALTNALKHAKAREAAVRFEAPGGSLFRFEVASPVKDCAPFREGFGLKSMRERLQSAGGGLDVWKADDAFIVRGWMRKADGGDGDDPGAAGGRPGDGAPGAESDAGDR